MISVCNFILFGSESSGVIHALCPRGISSAFIDFKIEPLEGSTASNFTSAFVGVTSLIYVISIHCS